MTIDKAKFQAVLSQLTVVQNATILLGDDVDAADPENTFSVLFNNIFGNLASVEEWANSKILEADQEAVMVNFLEELKVVFDKYAASSAITPFETGYGTSYGEPGLGYVLTATFEGVESSKDIKKSVINGADLV